MSRVKASKLFVQNNDKANRLTVEWSKRHSAIVDDNSDFSERAPLRPKGATQKEGDLYRKVIISYDSKSHFSILFQMYGSVWRYVWPYCLLNMAITYLVDTLRDKYDIDLTIEDSGHMYVSTLVSFLLVTRVKIAYDRFMSSRKCVDDCLRSARSLIQFMNVFSMRDQSKKARDWRNEVAYRVIILMRVTFAALEFKESGVPAFESSMLRKKNQNTTPRNAFTGRHSQGPLWRDLSKVQNPLSIAQAGTQQQHCR
mmetsp:Transcript_23059/g.35583  ORF Transcript_23059/g.35583 Transcript_23059/m.35583 type:complete len:255 (-) Transcript_23059:835-1599(-)